MCDVASDVSVMSQGGVGVCGVVKIDEPVINDYLLQLINKLNLTRLCVHNFDITVHNLPPPPPLINNAKCCYCCVSIPI